MAHLQKLRVAANPNAPGSVTGRAGLLRGGIAMSGISRRFIVIIIFLQLLLSLFLMLEFSFLVFGDRDAIAWRVIELFEIGKVLLSIVALLVGAFLVHVLVRRNRAVEDQLRVASGAFHELMLQRFSEWSLTRAEADVAILSIKGLSISEIAALRRTSEGTVKSQSNALYRKAGVSNRTQLLSLFLDELMSGVIDEQSENRR